MVYTRIIMTREEKCRLFEDKGFTYDPETGEIRTHRGITPKPNGHGYINLAINLNGKTIRLYGHQFAWWMTYREVPDENLDIDHHDRIKINNKISNLILTTQQKNVVNSEKWENSKGYYFYKDKDKWRAIIQVNWKRKHLGYFDTKEEARTAYLTALAFYYPERYKTLEDKNLLDQV